MNFVSRNFVVVSTRRQSYDAGQKRYDALEHKFLVTHIYCFYNVVFILYLRLLLGYDGLAVLDVVAVFLVSCHGSKSNLGQSYEIYFIQPNEFRRNMMNRKERKQTFFCIENEDKELGCFFGGW